MKRSKVVRPRRPAITPFVGAVWSSLRYTPGDGLATLIVRTFEKLPRLIDIRTVFPHKEREIVANVEAVARIIAGGKYCLFHFEPDEKKEGWIATLLEPRTSPVHTFQLPYSIPPDPDAEFDKKHGLTMAAMNARYDDLDD